MKYMALDIRQYLSKHILKKIYMIIDKKLYTDGQQITKTSMIIVTF